MITILLRKWCHSNRISQSFSHIMAERQLAKTLYEEIMSLSPYVFSFSARQMLLTIVSSLLNIVLLLSIFFISFMSQWSVAVKKIAPLILLVVDIMNYPSPPVDNIWTLMIVWRIREQIIGTVLSCIVYNNCAQWYAHTSSFYHVMYWVL